MKSNFDLATQLLQISEGLLPKLNSNRRVFIWPFDVATAMPLALCTPLQELSCQCDGTAHLHQFGSRPKGNRTPAYLGKWPMARTSSPTEAEKGNFSFDSFYSTQGTSQVMGALGVGWLDPCYLQRGVSFPHLAIGLHVCRVYLNSKIIWPLLTNLAYFLLLKFMGSLSGFKAEQIWKPPHSELIWSKAVYFNRSLNPAYI